MEVLIDYTNHAGVRAVRRIDPHIDGFRFGSTEWHPEKQWLLDAYDVDKDAKRTFALSGIHQWGLVDSAESRRQININMSIARQLSRSMESHARMMNRLARLVQFCLSTSPMELTPAQLLDRVAVIMPSLISLIAKDEEPTWPSK